MTKLPKVRAPSAAGKSFPFNGEAVKDKGFSFSFASFDRSHELFNLGGDACDDTVGGQWFLDLLDCLKSVSNKTIPELKQSKHDLHPVDWGHANAAPPNAEQFDYWQFRVNKSKGRVIGFFVDGVFYVVWLDPHHNLTDSEGYGGAVRHARPPSLFERQEGEIQRLKDENAALAQERDELQRLLEEQTRP